MVENDFADQRRSTAGRPVKRLEGTEPGLSYVMALRKWPDEVAGISRTELARLLKCSDTTLSTTLGTRWNWKATDSLLNRALQIIEKCGGTDEDAQRWVAYHRAVQEYQRTGSGELPQPPVQRDREAGRPGEPAAEGGRTDLGKSGDPSAGRVRGWVVLGLLATAVLLAAGVVWYVRQGPVVKIEVAADSDELVVTPAFRDTMGNYATTLPIGQVPAPPDRQDRCAGRHRWAHSPPINGVDAGSSVAKVDITALSEDLKIDRAVLDVRTPEGDPPTMVLLACPGRGGPKPPHLLVADLDTGELLFFPDGDDEPDNFDLRITAGETESIFVIGSILETHARWRLELGGDSGETRIEYTIGPDGAREGRAAANPDQRPFETIGEFLTTPYRFRDGAWQPGR